MAPPNDSCPELAVSISTRAPHSSTRPWWRSFERADPVAVLISGEGSNLQALIDASRARAIAAEIVVVVSNRGAARELERARSAGIPAVHLPAQRKAERSVYDEALSIELAKHSPDLVVLAGFMRILGASFVHRFAGECSIFIRRCYRSTRASIRIGWRSPNANPSTAPRCTSSRLTSMPGRPSFSIGSQCGPEDDLESLTARVHVGEHLILPRAVDWFVNEPLEAGSLGGHA